ncbi:MAG TPA: SDR family oxidoreductase [Pyrinomonadaceae bacterium]|nr:SDR family oxidoreductase [Pyrinomonadaceae bacterium]
MAEPSGGKVYLLTGSTGIAAATARLAARQGARLFVVGMDGESCRALGAELEGAGAECGFYVADLTVEGEAVSAVRACAERYGRVDALFNVAGISGRRYGDGPVHECTVEGWDRTLDANAKSVFLMCRETIRLMLTQPVGENGLRGSVLNMGSVLGGISPEPKHFATHAYAASKAAIEGMSRAMAAYYAPHKIRVNVIAPSLVRTPMSLRAQGDAEIGEYMKIKHPLGEEMIDAADVARAAMFLLGDDARRITGDVLTIDAGWHVTNS